jgi:putative flippase GtrA
VLRRVGSALPWRLLRFGLVGVLGFLVDAGVLHGLVFGYGVNLFLGRAVSFVCAASTTWAVNRAVVFAAGVKSRGGLYVEWARYFGASIAGGAVNYAAFAIAVELSETVRRNPSIGVGIGSMAGMAVNYVLYSGFVFRSRD